MGTTLQHGIFLPAEGERNCYAGLAANWNAVDTLKGSYSLHAINVDIHVTATEKETWNGKADASALTAHTGNTTIHVTAEDKNKWDAVTGKADSSALTAHTGNTTIHVTAADKEAWNGKQDALSQTQLDAVNSGIDSSKVQQIATNTSDISSLQSGKADDNSVVHLTGSETISGNKTFSSINGVEPSSLSLPSGNASNFIDISSYFSNTGSGDTNTYTAIANGWIYLRLSNIGSCQATVYNANNNRMWGQSTTGSVEQITIPILKGQTLTTQWATTSSVNVATARFIPCLGNI